MMNSWNVEYAITNWKEVVFFLKQNRPNVPQIMVISLIESTD